MISTIIIFSLIMLLSIVNKERVSLKKQLSRATNKQAIREEKQRQRQEQKRQKEYNELKLLGFNDEAIKQIMSGATHIDLTQGKRKLNRKIN